MFGFSSVGKKKVGAHVALYWVNIVVLALSARVNLFQEFFFAADLFPLGLSITTMVILSVMLALDFICKNSYTGRPQFEIGVFAVLSIFWLSFNAFSTSRWRHVPMACPTGSDDVKAWCQDVQALKAFVWIEWLIFSLTAYITLRYTISQKNRGNNHILRMPLSRYSPHLRNDSTTEYIRNSEFLQFSEPKL
ncbi:hypothetical protein EV368DRAFT_83090 [Lentinula lateritia]|uniref:Uncharacterized protein n=1 Tax=Lentinula aff. lateritia TaxID=2804960 RepID=A0ACC1TTG6_9AGAR|nr:hypothetical protein F5876DRAFT_79254 [Lentinula aff. lateritia]KAJ3851894.1 hypothetical protein EV368DRAFT_83090 [Lentinula lateritia]